MGTRASTEIETWLRGGGLVVTASDRAARALTASFHRVRRAEGLAAWPAPQIVDWRSLARDAWTARAQDDRPLLNPTQEQALWAEIADRDPHPATVLDRSRYRVAALAMEAHKLLANYAPRHLRTSARGAWQLDASAFSKWLAEFDERCRVGRLLSLSRMPLELIPLLEADRSERPPLLIAGFDRILPVQRSLFDAWGAWSEAARDEPAVEVSYYEAPDTRTELAACALWCKRKLGANPQARLLVIAQDAASRRGEMERALLRSTGLNAPPIFEFSLGVPLSAVSTAKAAHLMLRWQSGPIEEGEIDWLFSTGHAAASEGEAAALEHAVRELRRKGLERTRWGLETFCGQARTAKSLPSAWVERMKQAQRRLADLEQRPQSPLDWAEQVPKLLEAAGWPGYRPLTSSQFQAAQRWQQAVEACGSLGFDGRRMNWREFLEALSLALDETLFAPESRDAPIQIAGPAESAGLSADAVWFLGADENNWPARANTHPLLPLHVQREAAMPHATAQLDWELARAITSRILAAAPEVRFSYARQNEKTEARPSRVVMQLAALPKPLPQGLAAEKRREPLVILVEDASRIRFAGREIRDGASVLTHQSQCPFKAFAIARLGAKGWEAAEAGLTPSQRGQLIHAVMHAIWDGKPDGIKTLDELTKLPDLEAFVSEHVRRVLKAKMPAGAREQMPRRYLELEEPRLTRLVCEWLSYEAARLPFSVSQTEADRSIEVAGLHFRVRLDRIDKLNDGSQLVIDYKSGDVSPRSWELPRPDDVQLPLYAGFALNRIEEPLGGLVFAKLRAGERNREFAGRVFQPDATLFSGLKGSNALVKNPLTLEQLFLWREYIEKLARDFVKGVADVDPREYPGTCERCGLQTLCRVHESRARLDAEDGEGEDGGDE
jgi:ATP-dependent helicase/nuclease subunit B